MVPAVVATEPLIGGIVCDDCATAWLREGLEEGKPIDSAVWGARRAWEFAYALLEVTPAAAPTRGTYRKGDIAQGQRRRGRR